MSESIFARKCFDLAFALDILLGASFRNSNAASSSFP
jgi:hypothetical protein